MKNIQLWKGWELVSVQIIKNNKPIDYEKVDWANKKTNNLVEFAFSFKQKIIVDRIEITLKPKAALGEAVINGFQSWSECQVANENTQQKNLRPIAKPLMAKSGDYTFHPYKQKKDSLHSWHYIQFLPTIYTENSVLLASVSPEKGYTSFDWNEAEQRLTISQFCERKFDEREKFTFTIFGKLASEQSLFESFFDNFPAKNNFKQTEKFTGWTSWYLHYTNINEGIISSNLNNFIRSKTPINYFQIDDGWQVSVGDWQCNKNRFKVFCKFYDSKKCFTVIRWFYEKTLYISINKYR